MSDVRRLISLSMVPPLAEEVAKQIDTVGADVEEAVEAANEAAGIALDASGAAALSASEAALSSATAEAAAGPTYPDTAAGLAATSDGEAFAVDNGDGTVTVYLNDGGVAVEQRTLATTEALASGSAILVSGRAVNHVGGGTVEDALSWVTPIRLAGEADDTLALRRAVAMAGALGWAVDLGGKEYVVANTGAASATIVPVNFPRFAMRNGTVKIAAGSGQYRAIFGPSSVFTVDEWRFNSVTFDKNSQNNVIPEANVETQGRYSITTYQGGAITGILDVKDCFFLNSDAVVDVYAPEVSTGSPANTRPTNKQVNVRDCTWLDARTGGDLNNGYDQSFVNVAADSCMATGNTFIGESWERSPGTALELHADSVIISNNIVRQFQVGVNACIGLRHSAPYSRGVECSNNILEINRIGIYLWPERMVSTPVDNRVAGFGLVASNNQIHHRWTKYPPQYGFPRLRGIIIYIGDNALNVDGVRIADNLIVFDNPDGTDAMDRVGAGGGNEHAIGFYSGAKLDMVVDGLEVTDNVVTNSPTPGYGFQLGNVKNFRLTNNAAVDCGITQSAIPVVNLKSMYFIDCALLNEPVISGNTGFVSATGFKPVNFFYIRDRGTTGCTIPLRGNDLDDTSGATAYLTDYPGMDRRIVIDGGVIPRIDTPISGRPAGGSWLHLGDRSQADRRVKSTSTLWILEAWKTAPPTTGTWTQNSLIHNTTAGTRNVLTWICRTAGTPGTWRPADTVSTSGSTGARPVLTASDVGVHYIDTTLGNRPIWWTGAAWVDATGAAV